MDSVTTHGLTFRWADDHLVITMVNALRCGSVSLLLKDEVISSVISLF